MNRRDTLKQLLLASGGLIALPSWASGWSIQDLTNSYIYGNHGAGSQSCY